MSTPTNDLSSFHDHLTRSTRILALLGAGLSASSGLPTFRGPGGYWRKYEATSLATPGAFRRDPGLVWQFYSYRRHMALNAQPNRAHFALAELARRNSNFITLSQNVDGMSSRANHPPEQLKLLHGDLYTVKCWDEVGCGYVRHNDFTDPIVPALAIPNNDLHEMDNSLQTQSMAQNTNPLVRGHDISNASIPLPSIPTSSLPHCPQCKANLLRPGVVWFGESLPTDVLSSIDEWIFNPAGGTENRIDLMLVIGTSAAVQPAASYIDVARAKGARVAVINLDEDDSMGRALGPRDWFFRGDAAALVPEMLKPVIGEI